MISKLDSWNPQLAYLLGLLFADGHLHKSYNHVSLATKDGQLADLVCDLIPLAKPKWYPHEGKHGMYRITLGKKAAQIMRKIGLPPGKKTGTLKWPLTLPRQFARDFVRGFLDGDGSAGHKKIAFYSQSPQFLECIEIIGQGLYCTPKKPYKGKTCYGLTYGDLVDVARWAMYLYLYPTTDICLLRKRQTLFASFGVHSIPQTPDMRLPNL